MEVKINQEIREYTESMFFGLSLRQSVFSLLAVITAAALYFALKGRLHPEVVSWICIAGAVPFAAMGFVKYHGMNFEQLAWVWLRLVIEPKEYKVRTRNFYDEATRENRCLRQAESVKEAHREFKKDKRTEKKKNKQRRKQQNEKSETTKTAG